MGDLKKLPLPSTAALDLSPFDHLRLMPLKKTGDSVRAGEPLAEERGEKKRIFVSPASGVVKEVVRGVKRVLLRVVIALDPNEKPWGYDTLEMNRITPEQLLELFLQTGILPQIQVRPALRLPDPKKLPESVFVRALASAPFAPPPELEVLGREKEFALGLKALNLLCPGRVHLIFHALSRCEAFIKAEHVVRNTASGPHPIESASIHIEAIDPIFHRDQTIWTLDVLAVIDIGSVLSKGAVCTERVISVAGEGIAPHKRGFFRLSRGYPVRELLDSCSDDLEKVRLISGDPLMGKEVGIDDYIGFFHSVFCALPEVEEKREKLYFLRCCRKFYTATAAYLPKRKQHDYSFTTHQRGERRAFIDEAIYNQVMPMLIPVVPLIKALLAEDYVKAELLGLLEVAPEDFALPTFICPSKVEMVELVERAMKAYRAQYYPDS